MGHRHSRRILDPAGSAVEDGPTSPRSYLLRDEINKVGIRISLCLLKEVGRPVIRPSLEGAGIRQYPKVEGGPGVKPGFAASDATVLFSYTTHPLELAPGIQPESPD